MDLTNDKTEVQVPGNQVNPNVGKKIPIHIGIHGTAPHSYAIAKPDGSYDVYMPNTKYVDGYQYNDVTGNYPTEDDEGTQRRGMAACGIQVLPSDEIMDGINDQWEGGYVFAYNPTPVLQGNVPAQMAAKLLDGGNTGDTYDIYPEGQSLSIMDWDDGRTVMLNADKGDSPIHGWYVKANDQ